MDASDAMCWGAGWVSRKQQEPGGLHTTIALTRLLTVRSRVMRSGLEVCGSCCYVVINGEEFVEADDLQHTLNFWAERNQF